MEKLYIPEGESTPGFMIKPDSGEIMFWGQACPEDAYQFYEPIIDKLKEYLADSPEKVTFTFNINYYNTATSKIIVSILKILEEARRYGSDVRVVWYYDSNDEDMMISGEDFSEIVDVPFELKPLEDE